MAPKEVAKPEGGLNPLAPIPAKLFFQDDIGWFLNIEVADRGRALVELASAGMAPEDEGLLDEARAGLRIKPLRGDSYAEQDQSLQEDLSRIGFALFYDENDW